MHWARQRLPSAAAHGDHVGQQHREGLVADDLARAPDRMAEPERRLLAREARRAGRRQVGHQGLVFLVLAAALAACPRARRPCRNGPRSRALLRPVTKMKCSMPGFPGLVDDVLEHGPVDHRHHLLGNRFGGRQEPRAEAGDGKYGFADRFHATVRPERGDYPAAVPQRIMTSCSGLGANVRCAA